MKSLVAVLPLLGMCLIAIASPTSETVVMLESNIAPIARIGTKIALKDANCRYSGQLAKEPGQGIRFTETVVQNVDIELWYIDISRRLCGQQYEVFRKCIEHYREIQKCGHLHETVKMRVNLPRPPSATGVSDVSLRLRTGYKVGTKFPLLSND